jgi:hypothetical protein
LGSARGQEFKKIHDTNTHAADARPATTLGGINPNSIEGQLAHSAMSPRSGRPEGAPSPQPALKLSASPPPATAIPL